jgi:ubiquitin carboxyl-terminal hydrolase 9/13
VSFFGFFHRTLAGIPETNFSSDSARGSIVPDLFCGTCCFRCAVCTKQSWKEDLYYSISLSLPIFHSSTVQLSRRLEAFIQPEKLIEPNSLRPCERCNGKTEIIRQTFLRQVPRVLVLHLKRFLYDNEIIEKLSAKVTFPFILDVEPALRGVCVRRNRFLQRHCHH